MAAPRLGIILDRDSELRAARSGDPVDLVVLRSCFINQPRGAGARSLAARVRGVHGDVELVPYAWHYLTHEVSDGSFDRGSRQMGGDPVGFGHLKDSEEVRQAWQAVETCADALEAERIVLHTPPSFSPGSVSRRRLEAFAKLHAQRRFVWQPTGLWSTGEALAIAGPLGLEVLGAPLPATGRPDADSAGAWVLVTGERDGRFGSAQIEILADALAGQGELEPSSGAPHVLFGGQRAYSNLRAFAREWVSAFSVDP